MQKIHSQKTHIDQITGLRNMEAFMEDLERELARVHRYGHRITLLLLDVIGGGEGAEEIPSQPDDTYLELVARIFTEVLRKSDSFYRVDVARFAAILPNAYEAGGEAAALRLKRSISEEAGKNLDRQYPVAAGVVSVGPENYSSPASLLDSLKQDLRRDRYCQVIDLGATRESKHMERGKVLIDSSIKDHSILKTLILSRGYRADTFVDIQDIHSLLRAGQTYCLVMGPGLSDLERLEMTQKLHDRREVCDNVYIVWLEPPETDIEAPATQSGGFEEIVPATCDARMLANSISKGFKILELKKAAGETKRLQDSLSSIGSFSHQLNQPLQVIIGKLELLIFEMEDEPLPGQENILNTLKEIRKQALLSSEINRKIGRLTRYQND